MEIQDNAFIQNGRVFINQAKKKDPKMSDDVVAERVNNYNERLAEYKTNPTKEGNDKKLIDAYKAITPEADWPESVKKLGKNPTKGELEGAALSIFKEANKGVDLDQNGLLEDNELFDIDKSGTVDPGEVEKFLTTSPGGKDVIAALLESRQADIDNMEGTAKKEKQDELNKLKNMVTQKEGTKTEVDGEKKAENTDEQKQELTTQQQELLDKVYGKDDSDAKAAAAEFMQNNPDMTFKTVSNKKSGKAWIMFESAGEKYLIGRSADADGNARIFRKNSSVSKAYYDTEVSSVVGQDGKFVAGDAGNVAETARKRIPEIAKENDPEIAKMEKEYTALQDKVAADEKFLKGIKGKSWLTPGEVSRKDSIEDNSWYGTKGSLSVNTERMTQIAKDINKKRYDNYCMDCKKRGEKNPTPEEWGKDAKYVAMRFPSEKAAA